MWNKKRIELRGLVTEFRFTLTDKEYKIKSVDASCPSCTNIQFTDTSIVGTVMLFQSELAKEIILKVLLMTDENKLKFDKLTIKAYSK